MDKCNESYLLVLNAESQSWAAGTEMGGTGVNYTVELEFTKDAEIEFKELWVGGYRLPIEIKSSVINSAGKQTGGVFNKGETVTVLAAKRSTSPPPQGKFGVDSQAEGYLTYEISDKKFFVEIANFKKLEHQSRP